MDQSYTRQYFSCMPRHLFLRQNDGVYPALLPHSPASASSVTYVMFEKTFMGMPYCRQESDVMELDLKLPRKTMANWYIYCAEHYFYPIYEWMHKHLIQCDLLHADETCFFKYFSSTIKTNSYMKRTIMTRITRVSKESVFSVLGNLVVATTTSFLYLILEIFYHVFSLKSLRHV